MRVMVTGRQAGKTYAMVKWTMEGHRTKEYPGWSRIILTHNIHEADRIRKQYSELEYHQVFSVEEWRDRYLPSTRGHEPEIAIDNLDLALYDLLGFLPERITLTGTLDKPEA